MLYVIADVRQFKGLELKPEHGGEIARVSAMIRQAAHEQLPVAHPDYPGVGITISQLSGPSEDPKVDWKNAVTMATGPLLGRPGHLDRCHRPLPLWHRDLCQDGGASCQGRASA